MYNSVLIEFTKQLVSCFVNKSMPKNRRRRGIDKARNREQYEKGMLEDKERAARLEAEKEAIRGFGLAATAAVIASQSQRLDPFDLNAHQKRMMLNATKGAKEHDMPYCADNTIEQAVCEAPCVSHQTCPYSLRSNDKVTGAPCDACVIHLNGGTALMLNVVTIDGRRMEWYVYRSEMPAQLAFAFSKRLAGAWQYAFPGLHPHDDNDEDLILSNTIDDGPRDNGTCDRITLARGVVVMLCAMYNTTKQNNVACQLRAADTRVFTSDFTYMCDDLRRRYGMLRETVLYGHRNFMFSFKPDDSKRNYVLINFDTAEHFSRVWDIRTSTADLYKYLAYEMGDLDPNMISIRLLLGDEVRTVVVNDPFNYIILLVVERNDFLGPDLLPNDFLDPDLIPNEPLTMEFSIQ